MFHSKIKLLLRISGGLILLAVFLAVSVTIYGVPDNPAGIALFRVAYAVPLTRHSFLEFYSPQRRDVGSGYIPQEVDEFLCDRLENTMDEDELEAIVNFYALQSGGRQGDRIQKLPEATRERIAGRIIKDIEANKDLRGRFILLHEMRTGKSLGKGGLGPSPLETERPVTTEQEQAWQRKAEAVAKEKFTEWWNSGLSWEEKKKINPLAGTIANMNYCCG